MQAESRERPRFRQDLVAELIEDGATRFIDVADPDSGQLFRFYEVEYSLACAMDGERDVAGIVRWAEEELGLKPSPNEVRSVIATLGDLGYLERGADAAAAAGAPLTEPAAVASPPAPEPAPVVVEAPRAEPPRAAEPPSRPTPPPVRRTPPAGTPAVKKPAEPATNRWDQPTAMGDADEYLEPGVVAAKPASSSPSVDVELGSAGARGEQRRDDLPSGGDFELGAPGSKQAPASKPARGEDFALGASGAAVSTDLAADMAISPADVKEAVRASQVMKAADIPPELAAELEPAKPIAKAEPKPVAKAEPKPAEKPVAKAEPAPVEKKPEHVASPKPGKKPVEKPIEMPTERPVLPTAPEPRGVSPVLIGVLVVVLLAGIGFAVWKFVLSKKDTSQATSKPAQPTEPVKPAEPPPPPPVETAKLATEQPAAEEIKPTDAGVVATIVENDAAVKAGDPIARFVGFKPVETEVGTITKEIEKLKTDIAAAEKARDAAQTANNKAGVTQAETRIGVLQKQLATREGTLATKTAALDKFLIKAPADGKVTAVAKPNAKVSPTDIIATLTREPVLVATFKSTGEVAVDAKVLLAIKGGEQKLSCKVVATGGDGTKIACPKDAAPEGTEVTYAGVDTSAAAPADADKPADGSAAPADGDKPADGSAAPADGDKPADGAAAPADGADKAPADKAPAPAPAPKKAAPAPKKAPAPAEKKGDLFPPAGGDKPADKPAEPAPAPAPAPAP